MQLLHKSNPKSNPKSNWKSRIFPTRQECLWLFLAMLSLWVMLLAEW